VANPDCVGMSLASVVPSTGPTPHEKLGADGPLSESRVCSQPGRELVRSGTGPRVVGSLGDRFLYRTTAVLEVKNA
jgi:hypothetical protein